MKIRNIIAIIASVFMVSCATKPVSPTAYIPNAPAKTESVLPAVIKTEENIQKVVSSNEKLQEKTKAQEETILSQKVKITEAIAQAQRLEEKAKAKLLITEIEAAEMTTKIKEIEQENFSLTKQNGKLKEDLEWQGEFLGITKKDAADARYKLIQAEGELYDYREKYKFAQTTIAERNESVQKLQKENTSLTKKAASSSVYKNWVIGIVSALVGWTILKNILMVYFPATKFRI